MRDSFLTSLCASQSVHAISFNTDVFVSSETLYYSRDIISSTLGPDATNIEKKSIKNEKKFHEAVCILKRECHLWTPIRSEHGRLAPHISLYLAGLACPSCFIPHEKWQYRCRSAGRGSCQAAMFAHFLRGLMAWSDVGAVAKNSAKPGRSPLARHSHGIQHIKYVSSVHGWNC